jgi:hypothetical protein
MTTQHTVAVLFPGAEESKIKAASAKYQVAVEETEAYSMQKDYEKYFKPSWYIFHKDVVTLLFVFADGTAELVSDAQSLKSVMAQISNGLMQIA